jgi:hypothetical protein
MPKLPSIAEMALEIASKSKGMKKTLPPAENSQRTQIIGTLPTYEKAKRIFEANKAKGKAIDYGAGLGEGAKILKAHTFEPYAKDWTPTFTKPEEIPDEEYGRLTNLNVLNVVPREVRDEMVLDMGRVMRPKAHGIITTRGKDVLNARGEEGPEPMSVITSRDTYQKGFTPSELEDYLRYMLGDEFDVNRLNLGPAGALIQKKANGGRVHLSVAGDVAKQAVKQGVKKIKKMSPELRAEYDATRFKELNPATRDVTAPMRAEAGKKASELIKKQPQIKLSEALGNLNIEGKGKISTTQADRTRVGGGNIGGAPFSAISLVDPNYKGKTWGVMDTGTASRIINLNDPNTIWTTMLGSADQLKTNPIVFNKLKRGFQASLKQGNLEPELEAKINEKLATFLGEGADIRDPQIWKSIDTFEKRAKMADIMQGIGIGGEKSGKGVIFKPTDILKEETEPYLLHPEHGGDVPTFAIGPRLFTLTGEQSYRPDLHPGFPTLLHGEDLNVNVLPTETEIGLRDWHQHFKDVVEKANIEKMALGQKPRTAPAGYYDLALGLKGEGLPSQDINEEYLKWLQQHGRKDGGVIKMAKGGTPPESSVTLEGDYVYEPDPQYTDPMGMTVPSQDEMRLALSKQNMSPMPYSEPYRDPITGAILERGLEALPPGFNKPQVGGMTPIDFDNLPEEEKERTIGDRIAGLLETGTTLGTGALAFPYAFYKGAKSNDIKTFEDTMANNMYIPRDKGGIENLEILGKALERIPPVIPELHGLEPIISAATKRGLQLGAKGVKSAGKAIGEHAYNQSENFLKSQGLMPAITPEMKPSVTIEPYSPKDAFGFYSKLEKESQKIQRKQGNGQAFMNDLLKLGVKPAELEDTGMAEFLKNNKNLTKEDVVGFAERNRPKMTQTTLGKDAKFNIKHSRGHADQLYYDLIWKNDGSYPDLLDSYNIKSDGNLVGHLFETDEARPKYYVYSELADMIDGPFDKKSEAEKALKDRLEMYEVGPYPKHEKHYRTEGGSNYREVLVQIPEKNITQGQLLDDMARRLGAKNFESLPMEQRHELARLAKGTPFTKGHYEDFPNTMINMRMDDRVDVDGKKGTLLDELQSDWHQKGKEEGYATDNPFLKMPQMSADEMLLEYGDQMNPEQKQYLQNFIKNWEQVSQSDKPEEIKSIMLDDRAESFQRWVDRQKIANAIPDAPYKNNWYELGLKKAIQQSVERGDDRLYMSTGKTLADRYDLSKQISEVHYSGTNLTAYDHNGNAVIKQTGISKEQLPEYIGKEATKKLLEQEPQGTLRSLTGLDLRVGGEGMKEWYDKKYLSFLNKFAKKYGGHVDETFINTGREWPFSIEIAHDGQNYWLKGMSPLSNTTEKIRLTNNVKSYEEANKLREGFYSGNNQKVYYYEPSPEAKKKIMGGLPYKKGGIVKMAEGGSMESDPSLPLKAHLRNFQTPDLLDIQDYGVSAQDNGDAFTFGRQIASKNAEEENPHLRYRASHDYAQYSTPMHRGMLNARVIKNPEQPSIQAMLQYMQEMGDGTAGVGLMGNRTPEGDKLRALQMMYNKRLSDTSDISGAMVYPFGQKPQFNVQYRKRFNEGGSVAEREMAKMREILEMQRIRDELSGMSQRSADIKAGKHHDLLTTVKPVTPEQVQSTYNARQAKPTVGLQPINVEKGGHGSPFNPQLRLFEKNGGNVSIDDMRLALTRKR